MVNKKVSSKKGGFTLAPITLKEPVKVTDGFTNLVETTKEQEKNNSPTLKKGSQESNTEIRKTIEKQEITKSVNQDVALKTINTARENNTLGRNSDEQKSENSERTNREFALTENELLRFLDADSLDEIYELSDVLRASSLKLYATLIRLADSRGRVRVKNHELMSKAGIKGIATLYKQERWLMDLKLLEKKAKPGPHDGSSYVIHKLETLPLPTEIYEKFEEYLSNAKQ